MNNPSVQREHSPPRFFTLIELLACRSKLSDRRQAKNAFTLIELLVVIAIIAILASLLLLALRLHTPSIPMRNCLWRRLPE